MDKITSNELNNFLDFVKNQKIKENFKNIKFNEFIQIFINVENTKNTLKELKKNLISKPEQVYSFLSKFDRNIKLLNEEHIYTSEKIIKTESKTGLKKEILSNNKENQKIKEESNLNSEFLYKLIENEDEKNTNVVENKDSNEFYAFENKNLIQKKEKSLNSLIRDLKENFFNVNGLIISAKTKLIDTKNDLDKYKLKANIKFDIEIKIKDIMYRNEYDVFLFNINPDLTNKIYSLKENTEIFILNVKTGISEKNGALILFQTLSTKIFIKMLNFSDFSKPLILTEEQKNEIFGTQEKENKTKLLKEVEKYGRNYLPNKNGSFNRFSSDFLIDITKRNEFEYFDLIDSNSIDETLRKIPIEIKDISQYLVKEVNNPVYTVSNAFSINKDVKAVSVCGMILSVKKEEKLTSFELLSLKDSNIIKVIHFSKSFSIEFKENMIIILYNINQKINKNFDINIEIINEKSVKVLGMLTNEESTKFRKFRFDKNKGFDCILQLVSNKLVRNIQKVFKMFLIDILFK